MKKSPRHYNAPITPRDLEVVYHNCGWTEGKTAWKTSILCPRTSPGKYYLKLGDTDLTRENWKHRAIEKITVRDTYEDAVAYDAATPSLVHYLKSRRGGERR